MTTAQSPMIDSVPVSLLTPFVSLPTRILKLCTRSVTVSILSRFRAPVQVFFEVYEVFSPGAKQSSQTTPFIYIYNVFVVKIILLERKYFHIQLNFS